MTKIDGRTKALARQSKSTNRSGALQNGPRGFAAISRNHPHEQIPTASLRPGGALEAVLVAKQAGKIRFIGFTGHKDPSIHLHMLEVAAEHRFQFDTVQMPLNVMDAHFRSFEHQVLPVLVRDSIGVLGMKSMGFGRHSAKAKPSAPSNACTTP